MEYNHSRKSQHANVPRREFVSTVLKGAVTAVMLNKSATVFSMNSMLEDDLKFVAPEGANRPIGVPKGIIPGRVAWARDPLACTWNGTEGFWWEDRWNDTERISGMFSKSIRAISNEEKDGNAWNAVFSWFNQTRGKGMKGYVKGEKIALKVNMNNDRRSYDDTPWINSSPHLVNAVIGSLIKNTALSRKILLFSIHRGILHRIFTIVFTVPFLKLK
jgi:hypothetical protein